MSTFKNEQAKKQLTSWLQNHQFSASELDDYHLCPVRFFVGTIMKIKTVPEPEVELQPMQIGTIIHQILENFMLNHGSDLRQPGAAKKLRPNMQKIMAAVFAGVEQKKLSLPLLERQKKMIERTLAHFLEREEEARAISQDLVPTYFEWSFGRDNPPLELTIRDTVYQFRGRVDRIDVDHKNKTFLIIDYKTGSTRITGSQIVQGQSLQIPLYLLAVNKLLLPGYQPIGGLYYHLSDMSLQDGLIHADRVPELLHISKRSSSLIPGARWDNVINGIFDHVGTLLQQIHHLNFKPAETPCHNRCTLSTYCQSHFN